MRLAIVFLATVGVLASAFPSIAKPMSDARYMRAERCLAYSKLPQLQGEGAPDVSLLADAVAKEKNRRMPPVPQIVRQEADDIKRAGARADDDAAVERLKAKQSEACAGLFPERP